MVWNLVAAWPYNSDPNGASKNTNIVYYVYSRPSWVLGNLFLLTGLFTRHCTGVTSFLSTTFFRVTAKGLPIACLLVIFIIQCLFCGDQTPLGTYLTFPCALLFGLGFNIASLALSVVISMLLEFPFVRIGQITVMGALVSDRKLK